MPHRSARSWIRSGATYAQPVGCLRCPDVLRADRHLLPQAPTSRTGEQSISFAQTDDRPFFNGNCPTARCDILSCNRSISRSPKFKEDIIQAFYDGIKHKPQTTFGNVKADVIADKDPHFCRGNFCTVIRRSGWNA
jgi:hypothetical protein